MAEKENQGGKNAALVVAGGAVGAGLALLFQSKPAKAAPESDKLDYIATLLEGLIKAEIDTLAAIKNLSLGGAPGLPGLPGIPGVSEIQIAVSTPWVAKDPVLIFNQAIRNIGTFFSDGLVDMRNSKRLSFKIESSLDQAIIVQLVGNARETWQLATNIGPPIPCPANGNISIGLAWDDWIPFCGVQVTTAIAPAAGILNIWQVLQD